MEQFYIGSKGYSIHKASLSLEEIQCIRKDLTVKPFTPPNSIQKPVEFPIYRESPKKLYVPRFYGIKKYGLPKQHLNTISEGKDISLPFSGDVRPYQEKIIQAYMKETTNTGCGLLEIHCGGGKTVMALNIISRLRKKTLVIVHKEFLLNQWVERIQQFLPSARVGRIQGQIIDIENKDIVIGMLQSLSMKEYPQSVFDEFGLTIVDECHHISAEVFCRSLFKIVTKYMLGLSATMNRKDGLTRVFKLFLGDVVYKMKREDEIPVLVKAIYYKNNDPEFSETVYNFKGQTHYAIMIRKLCECNHRSEFILKVLKDILEENNKQQVMILAHNKSLLKYLFDAIQHRKIGTVGYYIGGMKEKDLKETEGKQVVIATYAMAEEALDIKTLSALIMATPKTDVTQAVGRILRMKHDNPLVVDIIDQHDIFQRQFIKRKKFYKSSNYKIIETSVDDYRRNIWNTLYQPNVKSNQIKQTNQKNGCLLDVKVKVPTTSSTSTSTSTTTEREKDEKSKYAKQPLLQGKCLIPFI